MIAALALAAVACVALALVVARDVAIRVLADRADARRTVSAESTAEIASLRERLAAAEKRIGEHQALLVAAQRIGQRR